MFLYDNDLRTEDASPKKIIIVDSSKSPQRLQHMDKSSGMAFFSIPVYGHCGKLAGLTDGYVVLAAETKEEADEIVADVTESFLRRQSTGPKPERAVSSPTAFEPLRLGHLASPGRCPTL